MVIDTSKFIRNLGYTFVLIFYIKTFITEIVDIPHFYTISTIVVMVPCFFILYSYSLCKCLPKFFVYTLLFHFVFVIFTISNPSQIPFAIARLIRISSFVLLLEYLYSVYNDDFIEIIMFFTEVLNYANLLSMILFPNGIHHMLTRGIYEEIVKTEPGWVRTGDTRVLWLLGHQTGFARYIIPAIIVGIIYSYIHENRAICKRSIILYCVCLAELLIANSATNYLVVTAYFVFIILLRFNIKIKVGFFFPIYFVFYSLVGLLSDRLRFLEWMSQVMGRTVRISNRVVIWKNTIDAIIEHPLLGHGAIDEDSELIRQMLGLGNPHSQFLWVLFEAGIFGLSAWYLYMKRVERNYSQITGSNSISIMIYAGVLSTMVAMLSDDYLFRNPYTLLLFFFCYHCPEIGQRIMGSEINE